MADHRLTNVPHVPARALYHVDAFTTAVFSGSRATVCPLDAQADPHLEGTLHF